MTDAENLPALWGTSFAAGVALSTAVVSACFEMAAESVSVAASGSSRRECEVIATEVHGTEKVLLVDARELEEPEDATRGIVSDGAVNVGDMR